MAVQLFNALLTANFAASSPLLITSKEVVLDFLLTIPAGPGVNVEWYPEYTDGVPLPPTASEWFRETSEEDIGNGDVRMNEVIRRFSPWDADAVLPAGVHKLNVQLRRTHGFVRIWIRGDTAVARITASFGKIATV
jgi:hypothetical protein